MKIKGYDFGHFAAILFICHFHNNSNASVEAFSTKDPEDNCIMWFIKKTSVLKSKFLRLRDLELRIVSIFNVCFHKQTMVKFTTAIL